MEDVTINRPLTVALIECSQCAVIFGLLKDYQRNRREDHQNFYCPNGHPQHYVQETEAERLRKKLHAESLARERAERAREVEAQARASAQENLAQVMRREQRLKKRVAAGSCPCCKRTFKQLAAHMQNKHPDYQDVKK